MQRSSWKRQDQLSSRLSNLDYRQLFCEVDKLSSSKSVKVLRHMKVMSSLLRTLFFFHEKFERVKIKLDGIPSSTGSDTSLSESLFSKFSSLPQETVRSIVMKSPSSSCLSDLIPTWLLYKNFFHPSPWLSTLPCIQELFRRPTRLCVLHLWSKRLEKILWNSTIIIIDQSRT